MDYVDFQHISQDGMCIRNEAFKEKLLIDD